MQHPRVPVLILGALTGLPEYRNGGLLLDHGVLSLRNPALARERPGLEAGILPLAWVPEGGTWAAGRRIARAPRPGGGPPLQVVSDGTVF